ncbi:acyltransferase [Poriferisphaera sp. WC338]|uniref:acyltransferase n=1 Tax=Poriferisphaera sp. WC338 TaxID=3425129 RepID=UPI003D81AA84
MNDEVTSSEQQPKLRKAHDLITDEKMGALTKYKRLIVGSDRLWDLLRYELYACWLGALPGAMGVVMRKKLLPQIMKACGRGVLFSRGVTLRNPFKMQMGDDCVIADEVILDARTDGDVGMVFGDQVMIGQRALIACKGGRVEIGDRVGIGRSCEMVALGENVIRIEEDVMLGPGVNLALTQYHFDDVEKPISKQGYSLKGGNTIGQGAWLGANVLVMDGVTIGKHAIVASGAVVTQDIPDYAIAVGMPAKVLRDRRDKPVDEQES